MFFDFDRRSGLHKGTRLGGEDLRVLPADCTRPGFVCETGQGDLVYIHPETCEILGEEKDDKPIPEGAEAVWRIGSGLEDSAALREAARVPPPWAPVLGMSRELPIRLMGGAPDAHGWQALDLPEWAEEVHILGLNAPVMVSIEEACERQKPMAPEVEIDGARVAWSWRGCPNYGEWILSGRLPVVRPASSLRVRLVREGAPVLPITLGVNVYARRHVPQAGATLARRPKTPSATMPMIAEGAHLWASVNLADRRFRVRLTDEDRHDNGPLVEAFKEGRWVPTVDDGEAVVFEVARLQLAKLGAR